MAKEVVEVIYGKHRVYHVVVDRGMFSTDYYVKSTDGQVWAAFKRLDRAVQWAREKAAAY